MIKEQETQPTKIKYYGMISEITDINVPKFPKKFPMLFLCTEKEKDTYNKLMISAISRGFDPKSRKLCFTLGCKEGFLHEDIFNLIKELPEVDEDKYNFLSGIVHWNPVQEASQVLQRFIALAKATDEKREEPEIREMMDKVIKEVQETNPVGCHVPDKHIKT